MSDYMQEMKKNFNFKQDKQLNEIVYEGLRKSIISGIIPVGERINEKKLADELKISRTPMREAIKRIQYEGLLEYIPKVGSVVKRVTPADVEEIYQLRLALETLALTSAIDSLTQADYDELDELVRLTKEASLRRDYAEVIRLSKEFNEKIYAAANMPRLSVLLTQLRDYLTRFRTISMSDAERGPKAIEEHQTILNALRDHDVKLIRSTLTDHLSTSRDVIKAFVAELEAKEKSSR